MSSLSPKRAAVDAGTISGAALALFAERGYQATTMEDIGDALGIRGPSLYKHVRSKQDLLANIMLETMRTLIADQQVALDAGGDVAAQLRRAVEAHVRYHAEHRSQAFVGNREITNLETHNRRDVLGLRASYEHRLRDVIVRGCSSGDFSVASARLASYAILDMGIGVATWFRPDGEYTAEEIAHIYAEQILRMVGIRKP